MKVMEPQPNAMAELYDIIKIPDPVLKEKAQPVQTVDDAVRKQLDKMLATMYDAPGIGLAANQVGLLNRVLVMDIAYRDNPATRKPIFMINPEIIWTSAEPSIWEEGCLSIPGQYADVERPREVRVKFLNYDGKMEEAQFEDLGSHCVQHEIDHLNGVLFIDYLSSLKRNMIMRKVQKTIKDQTAL
jgi:peptide deformylase